MLGIFMALCLYAKLFGFYDVSWWVICFPMVLRAYVGGSEGYYKTKYYEIKNFGKKYGDK